MITQITALPKLYIGIDIHKRSWKVHCATDLFSGKSFSMNPEPEELHQYVSKHFSGYEVSSAYEAGCCGYSAHRAFESYGWRSLVVNPGDIHRKGKEKHTKTDKIDARLIARELKDGRLEGIHVPGVCREELRSLFRRRNDLVKDFRRIKSYIKMQLLYCILASRSLRSSITTIGAIGTGNGWTIWCSSTQRRRLPWIVACAFSDLWTRSSGMFLHNLEGIARYTIRKIICCLGAYRASVG